MTTYYAQGSPQTDLSRDDLQAALVQTFPPARAAKTRAGVAARLHSRQ